MAFLIQNTRTDDFIADVSGGWPDWTPVRSFAKRFSTRQEAEQFIAKNQVKGDEPYMKVVKEMKGLKEFVKQKKITEDVDQKVVIHTKNGKVDYIEQGTFMPNGVFIGNAGASFDKGFIGMDPTEAKNALVKFSHFDPKKIIIEGCKKVQEATSNLREGFGELEVYTSFGPGFGVQIYPSRTGELTAHVGYVSNGSSNGIFKKELKTDTELKAIDEIKVADLKGIERVLKKHLDALDSDLQKILKQYGYK